VTGAPRGGWSIERRAGTARTLHETWPAPRWRGDRLVGVCSVRGPRSVVLGSTQAFDIVDVDRAAQLGVEVVRRDSGGGAVLVGPAAQVWLDVWLPRDDPLWDDDVIRSSWWLGETWTRALGTLGARGLQVHRGRATKTAWSDVCFAGLGPGELTTGTRKLVGVAQRRTREGARLYSVAPLTWEPAPLVGLLALDAARRALCLPAALDDVATGVRSVVSAPLHDDDVVVVTAVEDALLAALP
jgi:hypothetical protein